MVAGIFIGVTASFLIICLVAAINSNKELDFVKKPDLDAELTNAQAVQQLQEVKPYFAYKGKTWTALDMAIKALQEGENGKMGS